MLLITELGVWLIFLLPIGSFVAIAFIVRPFLNRYSRFAAYLTILSILLSLVLSCIALASVINVHGGSVAAAQGSTWSHSWLRIGDDFDLRIGILLDPLTAIMLVVVTSVSLLVQIYSVGYMRSEEYSRYYAYMSLFTASMLGLVISSNIIQLFVFWELVGLCSYLLIGFWYHRPSAAAAAKKAFIVTRLGDFGFLLAIMYLFFNADRFAAQGLDPFVIEDIYRAVAVGGLVTTGVAMWLAVGIFSGAVGKSAQFPLHTWLPDAMEGPTPVSALIHAATMVAAGVFLVARSFPVFQASDVALNTVAIIGGFTAIFAASMGLVMTDIKRVLAYSTVSQLGYMMLALGVGAYAAAIFHLFTHAFFKALLFLGSGSVNHATGTFDMRQMGGLRRHMPWTYATFLIGGLSLAGIFPFAGFWSKDEILTHAWGAGSPAGQAVFWMGLVAAFMTAFYVFRALFLTFEGESRGGGHAEHGQAGHHNGGVHLGESPAVMVVPLVVLAVPSLVAGFLANPIVEFGFVPIHWMTEFLAGGPVEVEAEPFDLRMGIVSTVVALGGIALAYLMYGARRVSPETMGARFKPLYSLLVNKYYLDDLYEGILTVRVFYARVAGALDWIDKSVVDNIYDGIAWFGRGMGRAIGKLQTGQLQGYGVVISIGILVIFGIYLFFR